MSATHQNSRPTQKFSQSMGGSMKSILAPGTRTYFVLEHKTADAKHKLGQVREYMSDYIEMGRGDTFAVNFGADCATVSRPHAAIARKGDDWVLQPLSRTNPTLLNNRSIQAPALLNNGDEIQLSLEGPKVAFLLPANNQVSKLGMTNRLRAMVNESVRPYKRGIAIVSTVALVLIVGLAVAFGQATHRAFEEIAKNKAQQKQVDSMYAAQLSAANAQNKDLQKQLGQLSGTIKKLKDNPPASLSASAGGGITSPAQIAALFPDVYFIKVAKIRYSIGGKDEEVEVGMSATGFLLNDGRFVTARHVVEPWYFWSADEESDYNTKMKLLNIVANNGGTVSCELNAFSSSGKKLVLESSNFRVNRSN
ncbi:MAG: FHA domain-containing protein, partial [Chitinophagia bacterium]|nr:FHA domain-containing protein [Chitinophagia bacterium]